MAVANIVTLDPTDTFSDWLNKTNELVEHLRDHTVTAEVSAFANTDGNARLNGELVANTVWVADNLTGGVLAGDGVGMNPADLIITSNTVFTGTADLVTVTNETLLIGDVEARSNVSITGLAGSTRIEGANIDFLTTGARLSTVRTDEDGSLFIGADAGNTGVANTHIVLSTDGITALEIDRRDVRFSNNLGTLQNFVWDSTNERLGIHTAAPTVELDVTGNTHTTGLTVHTDATIGQLANTNILRVRSNATIDNNLTTNKVTTSNTLVIEHSVTSDLIPTTDSVHNVGNTTNRWAAAWIDDLTVTNNTSTDTLTVGSTVGSHLVPSADGTYNFGNTTHRWASTWIDDLTVTNTISGRIQVADAVTHTTDGTSNTDFPVSFVGGPGDHDPLIDAEDFHYNPSTGKLTVPIAEFTSSVVLPGTVTMANTEFNNITVSANADIQTANITTFVVSGSGTIGGQLISSTTINNWNAAYSALGDIQSALTNILGP